MSKFINYATYFFMALFIVLSPNASAVEVAKKGAEVGKWTMDYDAALKLAKQKELPIFINFTGSDWCGWCKLMDRNVFSTTAWEKYAAKELVLVTIDFPKNPSLVPAEYVQRNYELQEAFGVRGYPTFIILDEDGQTVLGQLGATENPTPNLFIDQVNDIINFRSKALKRRAEQLPDSRRNAFWQLVKEYQKAQDDLQNWLNTRPRRTPENIKIYEQYADRISELKSKLSEF
jgi:protein disulfide-isomerase